MKEFISQTVAMSTGETIEIAGINIPEVKAARLYGDHYDVADDLGAMIRRFDFYRDVDLDTAIVELTYNLVFKSYSRYYLTEEEAKGKVAGPNLLKRLLHMLKYKTEVRVWRNVDSGLINHFNVIVKDDKEAKIKKWGNTDRNPILIAVVVTIANHGKDKRRSTFEYYEDMNTRQTFDNGMANYNSTMLKSLYGWDTFFDDMSYQLNTIEGKTIECGDDKFWDEDEDGNGFFRARCVFNEKSINLLEWALSVPISEDATELRNKQAAIKKIYDLIEL